MRSSKWSAHGNVYLLVEDGGLTPELARELSARKKTDGVLAVLATEGAEAEIAIWNPDGSRAEMSGNGTRIAARWLTERTGVPEVTVRVGGREGGACMLDDTLVEQDMGEVVVSEPETVNGVAVVPVDVGNPHAVVEGDPVDLPRIGPLLEVHARF